MSWKTPLVRPRRSAGEPWKPEEVASCLRASHSQCSCKSIEMYRREVKVPLGKAKEQSQPQLGLRLKHNSSIPALRSEVAASAAQAAVEGAFLTSTVAHMQPDAAAINGPSLLVPTAEVAAAAPQSGVIRTFYKRHLPSPPATAFSSPEGKRFCLCCRQTTHMMQSTGHQVMYSIDAHSTTASVTV